MTFDFDRRQFRLLLDLFGTLGSRQEIASQFGFTGQSWLLTGGFGLFVGGIVGLFALADPSVRGYVMFLGFLSILMLAPQLVSQAADAFMNPAELSVLAHRPIRSASYVAAKFVYVLRASLAVTIPLNIIPAFTASSLDGTRWFFPLTYLVAVVVGTILTALAVCGLMGLIFRFLPIGSVRTVALWTQLVVVTAVPILPRLLRAVDIPVDMDAPAWSAIPMTWFAAAALVGQPAQPSVLLRLALPSMAVISALVVFGARALTDNYLTRASTAMRLGRKATKDRMWRMPRWPLSQATRGGAAFVLVMMRRDWQFRRMVLGASVGILAVFVVGIVREFGASPLAPGSRGNPAQFLPLVLGFLALTASAAVAFTDRPAARWIFDLVPASALRGTIRGTYVALLGVAVGLMMGFSVVGAAFWGWQDAALFGAYGAAVAALYVGSTLWLAGGLSFTKAPDPTKQAAHSGVAFLVMILTGLYAALQALVIFRYRWAVVVAIVVITLAAWLAARASCRALEDRVLRGIGEDARLGLGRNTAADSDGR